MDNYASSTDSCDIDAIGKESEVCSDDRHTIANKNITLGEFCLLPAISGARTGIVVAIIRGSNEEDTDKTVEHTISASNDHENSKEKARVGAEETRKKHLSHEQLRATNHLGRKQKRTTKKLAGRHTVN